MMLMFRVSVSLMSSYYFIKKYVLYLKAITRPSYFIVNHIAYDLSKFLFNVYFFISMWSEGRKNKTKENKKWSNNRWNAKLFACLNVEFCHKECELGSALFTEEHMVFCLNKWAGKCFVVKACSFFQLSSKRNYTM